MSDKEQYPRLHRLPYILLGAMTLASFVGPFAILLALRGGPSALAPGSSDRMGHRHAGVWPGRGALSGVCFDSLVVSPG